MESMKWPRIHASANLKRCLQGQIQSLGDHEMQNSDRMMVINSYQMAQVKKSIHSSAMEATELGFML